ncbi:hypothetical protein JL720_3440 [Aureococcus anophagefferens]|nr:hypothetical protein JL720_3440 [Aureococcus anophagefferens]
MIPVIMMSMAFVFKLIMGDGGESGGAHSGASAVASEAVLHVRTVRAARAEADVLARFAKITDAVAAEKGWCSPTDMWKALFCIMFGAFGAGSSAIFAQDANKAKIAAFDVFAVLDRDSADADGRLRRRQELAGLDLVFDAVSFAYPARREPCYDVAYLRSILGFVGQEPVLFDASLADNVRYGAPDATDGALAEVAALAKLDFLLDGRGYRIYASEGFWRTYAFYKALGPLVAEWKLLEKRAKLEKWSDDRARKAYDAFHVKAAPKIYDACISLGGIFIKMGQIAGSTFSFLLAQPYVVALEPLQDATPPRSYEAVAAIILDDTGKTVDDLFEDFARPVGSASIAQAHKATLSEAFATSVAGECPWLAAGADRTVVVKIQYPEIARLYRVDFENIVYIAELVAKQDALDAIYDLQERHLEELDFTREAWNLKTVGANMAKAGFAPSRVVVPQPVPGLVSPCVLAMQYLEGPSLKNVINEHLEERAKFYGFDDVLKMKMFVQKQAKQDRDDALYRREHGGEEPPEELLSDGLVNLDPHPGNVLVLDGGRLGLIDYGQVRAFEPEERRSIATIVHALYRGDKAAVFAALEAMPPAGFQCQHQKHFPRTSRRVTGILCGVGLLTMRVISLAKQWQGIAARVLADEFGAAPPRKPPPGEETKES